MKINPNLPAQFTIDNPQLGEFTVTGMGYDITGLYDSLSHDKAPKTVFTAEHAQSLGGIATKALGSLETVGKYSMAVADTIGHVAVAFGTAIITSAQGRSEWIGE